MLRASGGRRSCAFVLTSVFLTFSASVAAPSGWSTDEPATWSIELLTSSMKMVRARTVSGHDNLGYGEAVSRQLAKKSRYSAAEVTFRDSG